MILVPEACERARLARDRRFDGRFFVAVRTTGIYCRPICPAPTAKSENVVYFDSAAAAHDQGFRPCLRCRPEAAPRSPAWRGTEATVARALRLIDTGALDEGSVADLALRLGVGARHLRRLFAEHLGTSPAAVAQTRRIHLAKSLLNDTDLPMAAIALASGFGSVRRFNTAMRETYGKAPSALRGRLTPGATSRGPAGAGPGARGLTLRLPFREPFDWDGLLSFFAARAIPGVETVDDGSYRRSFSIDGTVGMLRVRRANDAPTLLVQIHCDNHRVLPALVSRLRRQFDLDADPIEIAEVLGQDPLLADVIERAPGLRLPGAFDGFETTVRGILGQQVTVQGATTLAGRVVARCGRPLDPATSAVLPRDRLPGDQPNGDRQSLVWRSLVWPSHAFPSPHDLAAANLDRIGIPGARARAVRGLAQAVADGNLVLDGTADPATTQTTLLGMPGIGPWTVSYVAMRVLDDPDAFPSGDLGLQRALRPGSRVDAATLARRAEAWRPWRAYAAAMLWRSLDQTSGG